MSVIKVNNITNRDGTSGPVIAGIATVSSTSHMVVPTGHTGQRVGLAPDPYEEFLVLALPFNSESVFDDISPKSKGEFSGRGSVGFAVTTLSLPAGQGGITTTSVGIVTHSKYYGTSVGFNTTISGTQALQNVNSSDYQFGGQDFTIEGWVYLRSFAAGNPSGDFGLIVKCSTDNTWEIGWNLSVRNTNKFNWYGNGTLVGGGSSTYSQNSGFTYSTDVWYHLAWTRKNYVRYLFVDGVLDSSNTDLLDYQPTSIISIGNDITSNWSISMYLQDLRIYRGVAKYSAVGIATGTTVFTPPNQIAI